MNETAEVLHHLPGRMRLRIVAARHSPARIQAIQDVLINLPGVQRVAGNAMLGTILVQYEPVLFAEFAAALAKFASEHGLFCLPCDTEVPCVSDTGRSLDQFFGNLNQTVQQATSNAINLKELLPLALAVYGFLFVDRGVAAAQWLNWLQFAFDIYIDLHEEEPLTELAQKVSAASAKFLKEQSASNESLRSELAALRAEIRGLAERLPEKPA
jgi:hypothetical protein